MRRGGVLASRAVLPALAATFCFSSHLPGALFAQEAGPAVTVLEYGDLKGWPADDQRAALATFLGTCGDLGEADWRALCRLGADILATGDRDAARAYFELFFRPVLVRDETPALFTGYYEPELNGSPIRTEHYRYPVYTMPPEAAETRPFLTRAEIEQGGSLANRGLEIAWVDDPVSLMYMQIQGSGRIVLPDGRHIRIGYAGDNGHPYVSVGQEMVRQGIYAAHQVSERVISSWVRRHPERGAALLRLNGSYVFFRVIEGEEEQGPRGAMNRAITPGRTVAVDPAYIPLGAPVWIEKEGFRGMRRLMVAQDTGSAIKGPQRADVFVGTGNAAWREAARMMDGGRLVMLLPIQRAYAMLTDDTT